MKLFGLLFLLLPPLILAANDEATRFFEEYKRSKSPKHLFSALALDPDNINIRKAELDYSQGELRKYPAHTSTRLLHAQKQFERARKFAQDFPLYRGSSLFHPSEIFGSCLTDDFSPYPDDLKRGYRELGSEVRKWHIREIKRLWYPFDLTDGINSLEELKNLSRVTLSTNYDYFYFCNYRDFLFTRFDEYCLLLSEAVKYLHNHPQHRSSVNTMLRECYLSDILFGNQPLDLPLLTDYLRSTRKSRKKMLESELFSYQLHALKMNFYDEALQQVNEENFTVAMDHFLFDLHSLNPKIFQGDLAAFVDIFWNLRRFCDKTIHQSDLPNRRLKGYVNQLTTLSEDASYRSDFVPDFIQRKKIFLWDELQKQVAAMSKNNLRRLQCHDINFSNSYGQVAGELFAKDRDGENLLPQNLKFFEALNSNFDISSEPYHIHCAANPPELTAAAENHGEAAIIFSDLSVKIRDCSGKWQNLPPAPGKIEKSDFPTIDKWPIFLNDDFLIYGDKDYALNIFDRKSNSWRVITDFFPEKARSLIISDGLIYALAGGEEWGREKRPNYMICCQLSGRQRKIIFSSERDDKRHAIEKLAGGVSCLIELASHKIVFLLTYVNHYAQVWEYDTEQNRFRKIFDSPTNGTDIDILWQGKDRHLYLSTGGWADRIYRIDSSSGQHVWLLKQYGNNGKSSVSGQPAILNGVHYLRGPWRLRGRELWVAGENTAYLELDKITENPPLLLLPECKYLFELDDDRMLFLGNYRCFTVKRRQPRIK